MTTLPERFEDKFVPEPNTGCWIWIASLGSKGYGQYRHNGTMRRAHVIAWKLLIGDVPSGLELDHLCRTRCCVNPRHLEAVTHYVNLQRAGWLKSGAKNKAKTHCAQGHEFSPENTKTKRNGRNKARTMRVCRECERISNRIRKGLRRASNTDDETK